MEEIITSITVDTLVDENDGDLSVGDVSLREAIAAIDEDFGGTIEFSESLITGNAGAGEGVIALTLGTLNINKELEIKGLGADKLTIQGEADSNVFVFGVASYDSVLEGVTITGGRNGILAVGGDFGDGLLTVKDSVVTGNTDNGFRGGYKSLLVENSEITNNGSSGVYITDNVTIVNSLISGNGRNGVINFASDGEFYVSDSIVSNNGRNGIDGKATVVRSTISGNIGTGIAAQVYDFTSAAAPLEVIDSIVEGNGRGIISETNIADDTYGGEVSVVGTQVLNNAGEGISGAQVTVASSSISGNAGVGITAADESAIASSLISNNTGGGIVVSDILQTSNYYQTGPFALTVDNSTVSGNGGNETAVGGILSATTDGIGIKLSNTTVSNNVGTRVGGIEITPSETNDPANLSTVSNSIVAENTGAIADLSGTVDSLGYNLIGDGSSAVGFGATGDLVGTESTPLDPQLGALQDNGGLTFTQALLPGSPAIDAGNPDTVGSFDQRGADFERVLDGDGNGAAIVDIGAFEAPSQGGEPPINTIVGTRGKDRLIGTNNNDLIKGLQAKDDLFGRGGNDRLEGGAGDDKLRGGAGDDVLGGGKGSDVLRGGTGSDTFAYSRVNEGRDIIADFELGTDVIDLSAILSDSRYDSATPFADYVRIGAAGSPNNSLVEVLDINRTISSGSPVFRELGVVRRVTSEQLDASSFVL